MRRMELKDVQIGAMYWWNDPDDRFTGFVKAEAVDRNAVRCRTSSGFGYEVMALPCELENLQERAESAARESDVYSVLGISREEFQSLVCREMLNGISSDYAKSIADRIADDVASDIRDTADIKNWNDCDARLGIGRVLLKAVGGEP